MPLALYWVDESRGLVGVVGREEHEPVHISAFWEEKYRMVAMPLDAPLPETIERERAKIQDGPDEQVGSVIKGGPRPGSQAAQAHSELFE